MPTRTRNFSRRQLRWRVKGNQWLLREEEQFPPSTVPQSVFQSWSSCPTWLLITPPHLASPSRPLAFRQAQRSCHQRSLCHALHGYIMHWVVVYSSMHVRAFPLKYVPPACLAFTSSLSPLTLLPCPFLMSLFLIRNASFLTTAAAAKQW